MGDKCGLGTTHNWDKNRTNGSNEDRDTRNRHITTVSGYVVNKVWSRPQWDSLETYMCVCVCDSLWGFLQQRTLKCLHFSSSSLPPTPAPLAPSLCGGGFLSKPPHLLVVALRKSNEIRGKFVTHRVNLGLLETGSVCRHSRGSSNWPFSCL